MKVFIRPLRFNDANISYKWRNDKDVWKYTFNRPNIKVTPSIEKKWISNVLKDNTRKTFAICVGKELQYIGNIQILDIKDGSGEFGIFIGDKRYWNKGIGHKAIRCLINYVNEFIHLEKMFLLVKKDNIRAYRCYLKAGFTNIGMINETDVRMEYEFK